MGPGTTADAWKIGTLWVALTLAFEFLVGHYAFGTPWRALLADYNVLAGRIWIVLVTILLAPTVAAVSRGLFDRYPR